MVIRIWLICFVGILFSSCLGKRYVLLANRTDDILYFKPKHVGWMDANILLLPPDSIILIDIVFKNIRKHRKNTVDTVHYVPRDFSLYSKGDTIFISDYEYQCFVQDSIFRKGKISPIEVTRGWFEKQKNMRE